MSTKDRIFSQNWVEQFRHERQEIRLNLPAFHYGRDIFSFNYNPRNVIISAFSWDNSPQGRSVWVHRSLDIEVHYMTR